MSQWNMELGQHIVEAGRTAFALRRQKRSNMSIDVSAQKLAAALESLGSLLEKSAQEQIISRSRRIGLQ